MSTQIEINKSLVNYLSRIGYHPDSVVDELIKETQKLSKTPQMQIAPEQGKFLEIIVKLMKAKNCLEIGRFTGLSTLSIARGLPHGGTVLTVDNSIEFQDLAEKYWEKAKVKHKIKSIIGEGTYKAIVGFASDPLEYVLVHWLGWKTEKGKTTEFI